MDKQIFIYLYTSLLLSSKKKWTIFIHNNSLKNYAEWKNDTHIMHCVTPFLHDLESVHISTMTETSTVVAWEKGLGRAFGGIIKVIRKSVVVCE